jgi:hypothetical protein
MNKGNNPRFPYENKEIQRVFVTHEHRKVESYEGQELVQKMKELFKEKQAWKTLENIHSYLVCHNLTRLFQRKQKDQSVERALSDPSYLAIIQDFTSYYLNVGNQKAHALVIVCYDKLGSLRYRVFFMPPASEEHTSQNKMNFVAACFQELMKFYPEAKSVDIWSDTCKSEFVNNFLLCFYSQEQQRCGKQITYNTFEPHHGHSEADGWAGSSSRYFDLNLMDIKNGEIHNRNFLISSLSNMNYTDIYDIEKYPILVPQVKAIYGISFHRSFIFPHPGHVIMRYATNDKSLLHPKMTSTKKKIAKRNNEGEYIFEWVPKEKKRQGVEKDLKKSNKKSKKSKK